eukprot:CAMPEP_0194341576 /NCGR_PEP_ID=MMETSP0171-20130528/90131_1 /TAXON_ID=218684 /ORGANISM="Corethron pennatum, Strain L29A3" /LENGTH=362 /DNA_ID=CAMNT_0039106973 /DNA_START=155 /DNA_END=1240 /DNA_ORIENTATION=+
MNSEAPFGRRMGPGVRPGRVTPPPASSRQPYTLGMSESASWDGSIASFTSSVATAPTVNTWSRDPRQPPLQQHLEGGFPSGVPAGAPHRDVSPDPFSRIEEEAGALPAGAGGGLGHGRHKRLREAIAARKRAAAASGGGEEESAARADAGRRPAAGRRWDDQPPDAAQQQQVQQQQVQQQVQQQQQQVQGQGQEHQYHHHQQQQQQQYPQRYESGASPPTFQEQESPPPPSPPSPQEALPTGGPFARPDMQLSIAEPQRQNMMTRNHRLASDGSASVSSRHSSPGPVPKQGSFDGSETSSHLRNLPPLQRQIMMASYRHNRAAPHSDASQAAAPSRPPVPGFPSGGAPDAPPRAVQQAPPPP